MDQHPGIVFRDGPAGRRAGLAVGPDVWEIISAVRSSSLEGESAVAAAADWVALTTAQVRFAVGYYAEYPDEIDERIRLNIEEADAGEERWRREQNALQPRGRDARARELAAGRGDVAPPCEPHRRRHPAADERRPKRLDRLWTRALE